MLKRHNRISSEPLIQKLNRKGETYKTDDFVFKFFPSTQANSQFGVMVSKKIAPKAIERNKLRRQIYHSVRELLGEIPLPIVCLIIQKKGTSKELEFGRIREQVKKFTHYLENRWKK